MVTTHYRFPAFKGINFPKNSHLHINNKDFGSFNIFNFSDFQMSKPTILLLFWIQLNKDIC